MGEVEIRIAGQFLAETGLKSPLLADEALYLAGFCLLPDVGPLRVDGNLVRYDEAHPTWERDAWALVCSRLLRRAGLPDRPASRGALAQALGIEIDRECA